MSENKNNSKRQNGKGFYIALGLCLVAIGAAAWFTYGNQSVSDSTSSDTTSYTTTQELPAEPVDNTVSGITDDKSSSESLQSTANVDAISNEVQEASIVYPAGEDVIEAFSNNEPVYSTTLNDWRVHNGTDFAADQGTEVQSIADGTVIDVYTDDMYGKTIVIEHTPGFIAYYCGLQDEVSVNIGDTVLSSQSIGKVGTVPCECLDESHIHLMVMQDNAYIDPIKILDTNKSE